MYLDIRNEKIYSRLKTLKIKKKTCKKRTGFITSSREARANSLL